MKDFFELSTEKKPSKRSIFTLVLFLSAMFLVGRTVHHTADTVSNSLNIISEAENWGLGGFGENGEKPTGNVSATELKKYNAYYAEDTTEMVLYLTFDAGFENGNTQKILDTLKKHNVPACFFLVGNYLETNPELVRSMVADGHIIGNHTMHHPDMSAIGTKEAFVSELTEMEALYKEVTGREMLKYYRPPQGKYSESNLQMANELGYTTVFWSLAYVDWYEDQQPTRQEAFDKLLPRVHPGAVVLLHSTSATNAEILDELLSKWKEMGYKFKPVTELGKNKVS